MKEEYEFGTPEWLDEREEELDDEMAGFDITKNLVMPFYWNGDYKFRLLPVFDKHEYFRETAVHWNVIPGEKAGSSEVVGCPRTNLKQHCPICDAIDTAIGENRVRFEELRGENSILANKRFFIRVVLIEVSNLTKGKTKKNVPKFKDLPMLKILAVPQTVGQAIRNMVKDPDEGSDAVFHPARGRIIKVHKDDTKAGKDMYETKLISTAYNVEDWLTIEDGVVGPGANWSPIIDQIPTTTEEELMGLIEKHQKALPALIVNHALSIDVGPGHRPAQLPVGGGGEEADSSEAETLTSVRERLKKNKSNGKAKSKAK